MKIEKEMFKLKRFLTILMCSALLFTATACGGKEEEKYLDLDGIEITQEEWEALVEEGLIEVEVIEPEQKGNTLRINKRGVTSMVSGYGAEYDGVPISILAWRTSNGSHILALDVDFENGNKLDINVNKSAGTNVRFHELEYKDRNGMFEVDLTQIKDVIEDYIAIVMQ